MSVRMAKDTQEVLGLDAGKCESRSLLIDRFADAEAKDKGESHPRRDFCARLVKLSTQPWRVGVWWKFLHDELHLGRKNIILAKLEGRMILNAAGGVMENAGMCLDRFTGAPYIPGSAVKGCARRMAIQELLDAETMLAKMDLLFAIALAFGWGDQDWSGEKSDFRYGCGGDWQTIKEEVQARLVKKRGWKEFPKSFAGTARFLPAHLKEAAKQDLTLDVLTCHHPDYYQGKRPVALDTESPVPVVFPVVNTGNIFAFAVLTPDSCDQERTRILDWLRKGLSTFGVGGKTSAGYGWFDIDDDKRWQEIEDNKKDEEERLANEQKAKEERERKTEEEQRNREAKTAREKERETLGGLSKGEWDNVLRDPRRFLELKEDQKLIVVDLFRGLLADNWKQLREHADGKGKKERERALPVVTEIRRLVNAKKLPKLP